MDVARLADVSLATASRALHGSEGRIVREDLRERVLAAATRLNYTPNATAQAMARGKTDVIGLVLHDVADPYFSSIASAIMREADQRGLTVTMASTQRRADREVDCVATLRQQRPRALIVVGSRFTDLSIQARLGAELESFIATGGRVAMISQQRLPVDTVVVENCAGARDLAEALCDLGYQRFVVLAGPRDLVTARHRLAGFGEGLAAKGRSLAPKDIVHSEFTRDAGYEAMIKLLDRVLTACCVFAVNDVMALGAMAAMRDRGVALPGDIAVAGFDDITTLRDVTPGLTTVRVPLEDLGSQALALVLDEPSEKPRACRVAGEVVVRDSTPRVSG